MSKLERGLAAWRDAVRREGTLTREDVAELEVHLRDSVADLTRVGLTDDEAVLVALRRVGDPSVLAVEYHKVNPGLAWVRRWYWMAAGFLGFSVALQGVKLLGNAAAWLSLGSGSSGAWYVGLSLVGLGALCGGMVTSARLPQGWIARGLQGIAGWVGRRPVLAAHVGFSVLAGLTILNRLAPWVVWSGSGFDGLYAVATFEALAAVVVPTGLFALGTWMVRGSKATA